MESLREFLRSHKGRRIMKRLAIERPASNWRAARVDENARIRSLLDRVQVGGQVGVVLNGMDCDCSAYHRESVRPAFGSVAEFKRWHEERQEWLDGPESAHLVRPSEIDPAENWSRDLALEAYEDGHPHVVYAPAIPAGVR